MIHIAICEGNYGNAHRLEEILSNAGNKYQIRMDLDVYYDGGYLESRVRDGYRYDIIFLEIGMKNGAGEELAVTIPSVDHRAILVFGAVNERELLDFLESGSVNTLLKPYAEQKVERIFWELCKRVRSRKHYFIYRYKKTEYKIPSENVDYFESNGRRVEIHMVDGRVEVFNAKLDSVERKLKSGGNPFLRVHQSYLVSFHAIRGREGSRLLLQNGECLPISNKRQREFERVYESFLTEYGTWLT